MKNFKAVAVMAVAVMALAGCATIRLDPMVTGTKCQTRAECIKDLHLPHPDRPKYVFLVDHYLMDNKARSAFGVPGVGGDWLRGNVEVCVAKALDQNFPLDSEVVFDKSSLAGPYTEIKIDNVVDQIAFPSKIYFRIDYRVTSNGETTRLTARNQAEHGNNLIVMARRQYPRACRVIANQVYNILQKQAQNKEAGN